MLTANWRRPQEFPQNSWLGGCGAIASARSRKNPRPGLSPCGTAAAMVSRDGRAAIACNLRLGRHRWRLAFIVVSSRVLSTRTHTRRSRGRVFSKSTFGTRHPRSPDGGHCRRGWQIKMIRWIEWGSIGGALCEALLWRGTWWEKNAITRPSRDNLKRLCRHCPDNGARRR